MLTTLQLRFLAARLLSATDIEAAAQVKCAAQTVWNWKQECPEFLAEYQAVFADGVDLAKTYSRRLLGKAAQRLDEALDATKVVSVGMRQVVEPDHRIRIDAAKLLFQAHGLLTERIDIELRIKEIAASLGIEEAAALEEVGRILQGAGTRQASGS